MREIEGERQGFRDRDRDKQKKNQITSATETEAETELRQKENQRAGFLVASGFDRGIYGYPKPFYRQIKLKTEK